MLSIILYGRNDTHGYNLQKRGSLSLNCIAEVLTEPSDEIIFVDYNTPDELPTFPEAIGDTLTDACKARLRILRVRPSFHRQFERRTRIQVLECQSRNIGIRRSNPANRWVLSTNTDMIFSPSAGGGLSEIVGGLEDGYYHLPRFEIPEGFWERLSRQDPRAAIIAMRENAERFHLNEIVYGSYDNLYEGPGDFQLFLRDDLFRIAGFDERMILGWHADANIARRMRLLRGKVSTAFDAIYAYHCGHTRQATQLHQGIRTENDQLFFVRDVAQPDAPWQAGTWGALDEKIEEIRLDGTDRYFAAMARAIPTSGPPYTEATAGVAVFVPEAYDAVGYRTDHVLPHLCDLLFNLPADQTIFFYGDDDRLIDGLQVFLQAAGKSPRLIRYADHQDEAALDGALADADVFVIEYPSPDSDRPALADRAWRCRRMLELVATAERARPNDTRRRVVVVNSIHNAIASEVETLLAPSSMPFSTRLRQGFVRDAPPPTTQEWSPEERALLTRLLEGVACGDPPKDWERLALEIRAIATSESEAAAFGLGLDQRSAVAAACDRVIDAAVAKAAAPPVEMGLRPDAATRLCSSTDWADPAWIKLARTCFHWDRVRLSDQTRWVWARLGLARELLRVLPPGRAMATPRILLVTAGPDVLAPLLIRLGYDVTYATVDDVLGAASEAPDWQAVLDQGPDRLPMHHRPFDAAVTAKQDPFAVIVLLMPAWVERGTDHVEALLQALAPFAGRGTALIAAATVQLNRIEYEGAFTWAEWVSLFDATGPLGRRGFTARGEIDQRIPLDTVVRFAFQDAPGDTIPGLSYGFLEGFNTPALICARWPERLQL